jgi:hypothetical protein
MLSRLAAGGMVCTGDSGRATASDWSAELRATDAPGARWHDSKRRQACRACPAIPVMHKPPGALRRVGRGSQRKGTCEWALTCISPASHRDTDAAARLLLVPVGFVLIF